MSDQPKQDNSGDGAVQIGSAGGHVTVVQINQRLLTAVAESQLQANFYTTTGMRCSRNVRVLMEQLMAEHGFTAHELKRPWQSGALVEVKGQRKLAVATRAFDLVLGWSGVLGVGAFFAWFMTYLIQAHGLAVSLRASTLAAGVVIACLGVLILFFYSFIWPQHTAKRAVTALQAPAQPGQAAAQQA